MLREHQKLLDRIAVAISGALIVNVYCVYYWLVTDGLTRLSPLREYLGTVSIIALAVMVAMYVRNFSISNRFISPLIILRELVISYVFGALIYSLYTYIFNLPHLSRFYLIGGMIISYGVLALWHLAAYWMYRELRAHSLNYKKVLLIGNEYTLPTTIQVINENKALGLHIEGVMGLESAAHGDVLGYPQCGSIEKMDEVLNSMVVDYAIFTVYRQNPALVEKAVLACQERGIEVWLKPDFFHNEVTVSRVDYLHDIPLFIFAMGPKMSTSIMIKRLADVLLSFISMLILALPMLVVWVLVRRTSHGPALFKQKRIGLNGRKFIFYKFRTMYHDAEERRSQYRLKNEMHGPIFKMKNDPRITPIGRFLRKYSFDELPQLWNVLIGDMSLVGPRPPLPTEVELYKGWHRRRLSMRPGITCLWQVMGRNKIADFEEWAKLDLKYIDEWSLWLDLKILTMTIPAVFKGTGI